MVKGSYAEDQGAIAAIQVLEQQYQQNTRGRTGRPHRPVEHLMVAGEVAVIAATHDPQRRGHRALAWRQYRAHQQHLRFAPGWVAEQRCEGNENGYNGIGQGERGWTFRRKWGQAILPCPYSFPKKCAKSRWGQDRLLQLLAHRHSARLPTVITVRGSLDQADDFLRTRINTADGFSKLYSLGSAINVAMRKLGEIPAAMADRMTFDSFRTDGGGIFTPEQTAAFVGAHAYVNRWARAERPNGWLMLMGPYGVGKTHLAVAAAVMRRNRGDDVYFSTVANLLDHLRAAYSPDSAVAHADLLMRISSAQLLVLDDMGAERNTPFAEDKLFQIVNHRYEERLPTIITTSNRLSEIDTARPRIASRLLDKMVVTVMPLQGPDYRRHSVPGGESAL